MYTHVVLMYAQKIFIIHSFTEPYMQLIFIIQHGNKALKLVSDSMACCGIWDYNAVPCAITLCITCAINRKYHSKPCYNTYIEDIILEYNYW